jgi:hypothetical protein
MIYSQFMFAVAPESIIWGTRTELPFVPAGVLIVGSSLTVAAQKEKKHLSKCEYMEQPKVLTSLT